MNKREAIELVEDRNRCASGILDARCRWLAAGYILRGKWKRVDNATVGKAARIRQGPEPRRHR